MKLIIRADDFGIADSVTWGALRGFQEGIVTSSGVMTNMPSSEVACQQAKIHPEFCFGQDINIATGKCVAPKEKLPTMVNEEGYFRRSGIIREMIKKGEEPFPNGMNLRDSYLLGSCLFIYLFCLVLLLIVKI